MPGRDARELLHGGGSIVGRGAALGGTWELRASHDPPDPGAADGYLAILMELRDALGRPAGSGACGGIGLATVEQPVCVSMSRRGAGYPVCYVGQAVRETVRVELRLVDERTIDATVLHSELPVALWVAFTDGTAALRRISAFGAEQHLGTDEIDEDWPHPRSNACWGPFH